MISKWRASAKNLLYHYRVVVRGMVPFSPSWDPEKQKQLELDAQSLEYIQTMSKIIVQRSKSFFFTFTSLVHIRVFLPLVMSMPSTNTLLIFTPSEAELSALREERGDNSSARPLVWLVELFLD